MLGCSKNHQHYSSNTAFARDACMLEKRTVWQHRQVRHQTQRSDLDAGFTKRYLLC